MPKKVRPRLLKYIKEYYECRTYKQAEEILDDPDFRASEDYYIIKAYIALFDN